MSLRAYAILFLIAATPLTAGGVFVPGIGRTGAGPGGAGTITFQSGTLDLSIGSPTSLAFGPDGRLYVASYVSPTPENILSNMQIQAVTIDPASKRVLAIEQIASGVTGVTGLAFDPTAPPSPVVLYASRQDTSLTAGFLGVVSRFIGPTWERQDVITGLPTAMPYDNHWTNGLAFDGAGRLLIAQGSATDAGLSEPPAPQQRVFWSETPLSAAILVADIHAPSFNGAITYSPSGPPANDSVTQTGGDVSVFAPGFRNPYDLVLHSNGRIYATDNGAEGFSYSLTCTTNGSPSSVSDELNLVEAGRYYGFPNRNRALSIPDPRQCHYRSPQEIPGPADDFTAPIAILPDDCSCDGIAEYTSGAFGGAMQGNLIYVGLVTGKVYRAVLSSDGSSADSITTLASNFQGPLGVAVGSDGTIYVGEYLGHVISYLEPMQTSAQSPTPTDTPTSPPSATPTPPRRIGDANCDGRVNSIDAAFILQYGAGLVHALPCQQNGDVNHDGRVDAIDATLILQFDAGLLHRLPP